MEALANGAAAPAAPASQVEAGRRLVEIDMMRGFVIVLMALDHVRDYFHNGAFRIDLLNPEQTTPLLYATRWITHLCAPTFVFLAGVSAYLQAARGKSGPALSRFLLTRGLWLIFLEATVLSFGWSFGFPYPFFLQVIWAIGWSMVALAALVLLPANAVLAIGLVIVCGHNLLDPIKAESFGDAALLWSFLHEGGPIMIGEMPIGVFAYPVLPWIGVIACGYGAGRLFLEEESKRHRTLLIGGASMIALFLLLRAFNLYGNPSEAGFGPFAASGLQWQDQPTLGAKIMNFFDVEKYPPSLQYLLITLGICACLLPLIAKLKGLPAKVLLTFGAVPFFFYVLHVYLVHALAIAANAAAGKNYGALFDYLINTFVRNDQLGDLGFPLLVVYLAWVLVLVLLYPLCAYWAALKRRRRDWWLSYL